MITAPFNFVPLSEEVFFPDWAEDVSHDVPFEDGESGCIDITITAKSPIFIRNHSSDKENPSTEFCNHNGEYYIPSTSVKGMIRSLLEIMSFGEIPIDIKTHSKTMSIRDMTNRNEMVGTASGCGFLKKDENNNWIIVDYGKPRTIEYSNKNDKIIEFGQTIINCNFDTAKEKYEANRTYQKISIQNSMKDLIDRNGKKIGTKRVANYDNTKENAYLVLTGGIDNKKNEFVFSDEDNVGIRNQNIDDVVKKFKQVYFESNSIDGNFWKKNNNIDIGIPIFYKEKNHKITDIGLSQLFKLAYPHTINNASKQILETVLRDEKRYIKLDLAKRIFGTVQDEIVKDEKTKKDTFALKGRVQFSHFKADSKPKEYAKIRTVLGSPNPSFYPEYIQQNCNEKGKLQNSNYNSLMNQSSKISGWKRYPLRYGKPKFTKAEEGVDSSTSFTPIGTYQGNQFNDFTFSGKIRFHNLKKAELGALVSALTFHDNQNDFYHNIGMAKSLGFGKIQLSMNTEPYRKHLQEFEMMMQTWSESKIRENWIESLQIKELFVMAYKNLQIDDKLKYLKLDPDKRINEFTDMKKNKDCLPKVSQLFDMKDNYPKTMITPEILEEMKLINEKLTKKKAFNTELLVIEKSDNIQSIENFINKYPEYELIAKLTTKKEALQKEQELNKFQKVDADAKAAWDELQKKKSNVKQYEKLRDKFIKKWEAKKNNKGSEFVLDLVQKSKQ